MCAAVICLVFAHLVSARITHAETEVNDSKSSSSTQEKQAAPPGAKQQAWGLLKAPNLVNILTRTREKQTPPEPAPPKRDPFAASPALNQQEEYEAAVQQGKVRFMQDAKPRDIPDLKMRGHLQGKNNEVVALLEIGQRVYIVREGDTIGLHEFGYDSVIRIKKINRLHLMVESGTLGTLIIVR